MTSHIHRSHGGYVRIHKKRVGGAVPLLNHIPKQPLSVSNKFVGIITPQHARPDVGGALLKNIDFGSQKKEADQNSRIKFIF